LEQRSLAQIIASANFFLATVIPITWRSGAIEPQDEMLRRRR